MNNSILESSKSMLDAHDLIREWFPKRSIFLDCRVASYNFSWSSEGEDAKVIYTVSILRAQSGKPAIVAEGETLYELLTRVNHKRLVLANESCVRLARQS